MADDLSKIRLVVGVMTGTSIDGVDAALVRIDGRGLEMRVQLVRYLARPLGDLAQPLRHLASGEAMTAREIATLAWKFGELHADSIDELLKAASFDVPPHPRPLSHPRNKKGTCAPDLIVMHGQTIFHKPPISWQLINPAPIEHRFKCRVMTDLRQADLAAGGQGAPITPLGDWILFRSQEKKRAIVNLGGFCNITILPRDERSDESSSRASAIDLLHAIQGFDVCACNHVLDAAARCAIDRPYDESGRIAASGTLDEAFHHALLFQLRAQYMAKRSLGTGDEIRTWIELHASTIPASNLLHTIGCAIARCILETVLPHEPDEIVLAGGGCRNTFLREQLVKHASRPVMTSESLDAPIEAREAICMAILGALREDGVAITLPQVTGRSSSTL